MRYNVNKFLRRYTQMTGSVHTMNGHTFCCASSAAACASARVCLYLDTVILAVSIIIRLVILTG